MIPFRGQINFRGALPSLKLTARTLEDAFGSRPIFIFRGFPYWFQWGYINFCSWYFFQLSPFGKTQKLVGGFNPFEKNSQIGSFPQVGVKIKHIQNHRSCRSHRVGAETTTYRKSSDTISSAIFLRSDASPSVEMVAIASPRSVFFWLRCIGWWTYLLVSWVGRSATSNKHPSKKKLPMLYSKCQRRLGNLKKNELFLTNVWNSEIGPLRFVDSSKCCIPPHS